MVSRVGIERGVVHVLVDAADAIGTTIRCDFDIALVAPSFAPRVADDVVLGFVFVNAPADSDNSVIDIKRAARGCGYNSTRVELENTVSGGNSNIHRLPVDRIQVSRSALCLTIRLHSSHTLAFIICTGGLRASDARSVGVVRFHHGVVSL